MAKPSSALSKKSSSSAMTSAKKMFGDLPPSSSVHRDDVLGGVLHDQAAGRGLAGEGDLGDALVLRQRLAGFDAEAVDDVEHAGRQQVADDVHQHHDAHRRLLGRLQHDAVAGGKRRRQLPDRHQQREVPGDDLADDAQRLVEMIGDRVVVDLGAGCLPGRGCSRRNSGNGRSPAAGRLPLVSRIGLPLSRVSTRASSVQLFLHPVGDPVQDARALGRRGAAPVILARRGRHRAPARCPRRSSGRPRHSFCAGDRRRDCRNTGRGRAPPTCRR